jgi:hypothetical protein
MPATRGDGAVESSDRPWPVRGVVGPSATLLRSFAQDDVLWRGFFPRAEYSGAAARVNACASDFPWSARWSCAEPFGKLRAGYGAPRG